MLHSTVVLVPRHRAFVLVMVLVGLLLAGCGGKSGGTGPDGNTPGQNEIWMQNMTFVPNAKTISPGTTITWVNKDSFNHTVVSGTPGNPDGKFASSALGPNGTFPHTFNDVGTYPFYCSIHTSMTGTITVQ
jgi:plastocyanin